VRTVAVLAVAQVVSEMAFSFALPFTPLYLLELGVPNAAEAALWAGAMAGTFAVAMGGMAPVWGVVADRFGHRLMIQRAFFGAGAAIACMALVQTPEQLLALRVVHGTFTGVVTAMATLVSVTAPRPYMATALGAMTAAQQLGISLGPLLGGTFSDLFGLRASFAVTGATLVATGVLVTLLVRRDPARAARRGAVGTGASERASASAGGRLLTPGLLAVVGLMAAVRFAQMAPTPVIPLFVQDLAGSSERLGTTVGIVLAATGFASTVSALLVGRLTDRFGRRAILAGCLLAAVALAPLHLLVGSVAQLIALRIATGLALGGMGPALQALMIDVTPAGRRGAAFGLLTTANASGSGAGPIFASVVAAGYGVPMSFVATMPMFALAGWLLARIRPPHPSDTNGQPATGSR